jgi:hypothetical protein
MIEHQSPLGSDTPNPVTNEEMLHQNAVWNYEGANENECECEIDGLHRMFQPTRCRDLLALCSN